MKKPGESIFVEENVCEIFDGIYKEEILLPDFQRGFVWDDEKIRPFIASVLTKLPVGSLLMLEAEPSEYACRKIGRNEMIAVDKGKKQELIYALLDGQQRVTVLTHTFTDFMIDGTVKYGDLASPKMLYRRQFLKIPAYLSKTDDEKYGLDYLIFPFSPTKEFPDFTSEQIEKSICSIKISNCELLQDVMNQKINEVSSFCKNYEENGNKYFLIPLYYLYQACKDERGTAYKIVKQVLSEIGTDYVTGIMNDVFDMTQFADDTARNDYIEEKLKISEMEIENPACNSPCYKIGEDGKISEIWLRLVLNERKQKWMSDMLAYLKSCIEKMNINIMYVDHANRARAIEIYENINKGGKSLSLFDLVLARAALKKSEKTFLAYISEYISENHVDDYLEETVPDVLKTIYDEFLKRNNHIYSASERIGCKIGKNDLTANYCEIYLQVLALVCHDKELVKKESNFKEVTSRKNILQLKAEEINENCIAVCKGIDRACFFFQTRCGIRKLSDVGYKLVVVMVSYILSNDNYYKKNCVHNWLEAWYWSVLFSGEFNVDPSKKLEKWLKYFETMLESLSHTQKKIDYLVEFREHIFTDSKFSSKEFLLLEKPDMDPPKSVMRKFICQFYMAKTYKDFLLHKVSGGTDGEKSYPLTISTFMEENNQLNEHHIVPIGSLDNSLKEINQKQERGNKMSVYNSPLNFILITAETNKQLLNHQISYYQSKCVDGCFSSTGIKTHNNEKFVYANTDDESRLREILEGRFDELKIDVNARLDILGIKGKI